MFIGFFFNPYRLESEPKGILTKFQRQSTPYKNMTEKSQIEISIFSPFLLIFYRSIGHIDFEFAIEKF